MKIRMIVTVCGAALLIAAAVAVALREQRPAPLPDGGGGGSDLAATVDCHSSCSTS